MAVPSTLALATISDGSEITAAPHRSNYAAIQAAVNAIIGFLDGESAGEVLVFDGTDWLGSGGSQKVAVAGLAPGSNGQVLTTVAGATAWAASGLTFVGARAYHDANQSITSATDTVLALNQERYDTDAIHDLVTNNSRLTIPASQAGKYRITANAELAASATGTFAVSIRLNGTTVIAKGSAAMGDGVGTAPATVNVSTVYALAVADYVEIVVRQDSGGAKNVLTVGNYSPEFMIEKVG